MATETLNMGRSEEDKQVVARAPNLAPEIIEEILSRLAVKSLVRFRCVSKQWQNLLTTDSNFIRKHLNRQTLEPSDYILKIGSASHFYTVPNGTFENFVKLNNTPIFHSPYTSKFGDLHMVGSSNGLICIAHYFRSSYGKVIFLWNPATRQYTLLPPPLFQRKLTLHVALAFGFHPIVNDYRVVRLVLLAHGDAMDGKTMEVEIYSLSTNSWRKIGVFPYMLYYAMSMANINGIVHWVATRGPAQQVDKEFILSFDMADEVFREVALPDNLNRVGITCMYLRTFRGCLSFFVKFKAEEGEGIDVWIMKDYSVKESWAKLFTVESETLFRPIQLVKNGELLLLKESLELALYNSESKEFKNLLPYKHERPSDKDVALYVESLVPVLEVRNLDEGQLAYGPSNQKKKRKVETKKRKWKIRN